MKFAGKLFDAIMVTAVLLGFIGSAFVCLSFVCVVLFKILIGG